MSGELKFTPEIWLAFFLERSKMERSCHRPSQPRVNLPNQSIIVVHRSDGSGTTYIFTDYLSKISKEWEATAGKGTSVKWQVGLGGKGNEAWRDRFGSCRDQSATSNWSMPWRTKSRSDRSGTPPVIL